jgi:hypothetical protein
MQGANFVNLIIVLLVRTGLLKGGRFLKRERGLKSRELFGKDRKLDFSYGPSNRVKHAVVYVRILILFSQST